MAEMIIPELTVQQSQTGSTFLMCVCDHGYSDADIPNPPNGVININYLSTDPSFERTGVATRLLTSTIRGATTLEGANIESAKFSIINPVVVPLLRKVFDNNVKLYATEDDFDAGTNEIDFLTARILTAIRQEQFDAFESSGVPIPSDFDAGIHATAQLDPALVATWTMPKIVFA